MYLEFISVDSSFFDEVDNIGLALCTLSTRALQRLRNEVLFFFPSLPVVNEVDDPCSFFHLLFYDKFRNSEFSFSYILEPNSEFYFPVYCHFGKKKQEYKLSCVWLFCSCIKVYSCFINLSPISLLNVILLWKCMKNIYSNKILLPPFSWRRSFRSLALQWIKLIWLYIFKIPLWKSLGDLGTNVGGWFFFFFFA